ncbi:MAG: ABC transporter permease [Candidatus Nanopelagicales bacterium]
MSATSPSTTRLVLLQSGFDLRLLLRNGEQFLLTILIPVGLLVGLTLATAVPLTIAPGASRVDTALAGVLAVAVLSSAFTSLAIGLGFDRRSGALLLLATTPLSRTSILAARALATFATVALQAVILAVTATFLGWRPESGDLLALPLLLLGTLALGSLGFALAGAIRAEATLAVANAVFLLLLVGGGTAWPTSSLPGPLAAVVAALPSAALGDSLRAVVAAGPASIPVAILLLVVWTIAGVLIAKRTFRWS